MNYALVLVPALCSLQPPLRPFLYPILAGCDFLYYPLAERNSFLMSCINTCVPRLLGVTIVGLAALLAGLAVPAHAQLVTNGDFETADFTGWSLSGNADDTSTTPNTFVFGNPHSGTYAAWLGAPTTDGFLSQDIATLSNHKYDITYYLSVDSNAISGVSAPNHFSTSFAGSSLFSATNMAATDNHLDAAADYTLYSFTAVATGPLSTLTFGSRNDNSEFRLDDVSVVDAGPVPEASSAVGLGLCLSLGGILMLTRRSRRHSA